MEALDMLVPSGTSLLVYLAVACYAVGFVFKKQTLLRLFVIGGSCHYLAYYYFHPETPLWDAMIGTLVIAGANVIGLCRLGVDALPGRIRAEDRAVHEALDALLPGGLTPGQFRRLMRGARRGTTDRATRVLETGRVPASLVFVEEGAVEFRKAGCSTRLDGSRFVGDVAFVTGGIACDDAWIGAGTRFVAWPAAPLRRQLLRDPALERTLHALLAHDMAAKIARSVELPRGPTPANDAAPAAPVPPALVRPQVAPARVA